MYHTGVFSLYFMFKEIQTISLKQFLCLKKFKQLQLQARLPTLKKTPSGTSLLLMVPDLCEIWMAVGKKGAGRERGSSASLGAQFFLTGTFSFLPFYLQTDFMDSAF